MADDQRVDLCCASDNRFQINDFNLLRDSVSAYRLAEITPFASIRMSKEKPSPLQVMYDSARDLNKTSSTDELDIEMMEGFTDNAVSDFN